MQNYEKSRAMSIEDARQSIGCSRALIMASIERGELPAFRLGDRVFLVRSAIERLFIGEDEKPASKEGNASAVTEDCA